MQPRILDVTYTFTDELVNILIDRGTPPIDRNLVMNAIRIVTSAHDPRDALHEVPERSGLLELVIRSKSSAHRYGILFIDMGHAADGVAYWRDPPRYIDPTDPVPHGFGRTHALALAARRLERSR